MNPSIICLGISSLCMIVAISLAYIRILKDMAGMSKKQIIVDKQDYNAMMSAKATIDRLSKERDKLRQENKKLKLALEIKEMNDTLDKGDDL